jgi:hypothetical protein
MRRIFISLLTIVLLTPPALSLGMPDCSFGQVEQGLTYYATIPVRQSALDFENDFTVETGGEMAGWLKVTPMNFSLGKDESQMLNVTLTVPEDAKLGDYNGTIKAVGHRPVPAPNQTGGAAVGYTVATISKIHASVIKPGAVESIAITRMDAPSKAKPDSAVRFDVSIKNTGNIPATASPTLIISRGADTTEIPGVPLELNVGEEKTAKLYWDAQEEGTYTAVVSIACGGKTVNSDPISIAVSRSIPGVQAFAVITIILASAALLRRKRT